MNYYRYWNRTISKWCVIQPGRRVHQLRPVLAFAQRRVAHMMSHCFLLLICHWRWIGWWSNPTLKAVIRKGLVIIIRKQKNLRAKHLRPVNPLEEPAPTLLL
jgi:hypothetical protein